MTMQTTHQNPSPSAANDALPGEGLDVTKMPGHWVLARLGKRVLRPGGMELTRWLIDTLAIKQEDRVVEFAPGMGRTARLVLERQPRAYTGVERDADAARGVQRWLATDRDDRQVVTGQAEDTQLPDASASVVYGEAMLTMQPETRRRHIIAEAFRLLEPGGRYGIHELALDQIDPNDTDKTEAIRKQITAAIHHQAHPMRVEDWTAMLEAAGFQVEQRYTLPMALLEPRRLIRDEGLIGALRFAGRLLTRGPERRRVLEMRRTFRALRPHLAAVGLVARKPSHA